MLFSRGMVFFVISLMIGFYDVAADYRVPQVLRPEGVMVYSAELGRIVDNKIEIPSGSDVSLFDIRVFDHGN